MPIERKPISEVRRMTLNPQWPSDSEIERYRLPPGTLVLRDLETGELAAQVSVDDIFDMAGNRFWLDA